VTLLYAEVPRFYAEAERAADPSLAERPVIVGGDPRKRGLVQSATVEALALGVVVGMPVLEALERCPAARVRRTNLRVYREVSGRLRACFRRAAPRLEPAGLEAAYLDASDAARAPEALARDLLREVAESLGLPLQVGIAPIKFVAKLAAEDAGPEGVRSVALPDVRAFLEPLPVERLPGVGPHTWETLRELGIATVGDLAGLSRRLVEERLGNHGLALLAAAQGQGESRLRAAPHARSLSQESTLDPSERDLGQLEGRLRELAGRLAGALARERLAARRLVLKVRYGDAEAVTRSRTLARALAAPEDLAEVGLDLLRRTQAGERSVRGLGLAAFRLTDRPRDDRQLALFPDGS
jgi:nucleotidyltransferase/DNA polymerase involved in DNA repair